MAWYDSLLEMGAVPTGVKPKEIRDGAEPQYYPEESRLSRALRTLDKSIQIIRDEDERRAKEMKRQSDMYNTLRDAGYDSKSAYLAIKSGKFPAMAPGKPVKERKTEAEIGALKAKTKYYTTTMTTNRKTLENRILTKVANGETLTVGEQKIYDDILKKKGTTDTTIKLTEGKRKVLGLIRTLKSKKASIEDIHEVIRLKGYEPEDFEDELKDYVIKPEENIFTKGAKFFSKGIKEMMP